MESILPIGTDKKCFGSVVVPGTEFPESDIEKAIHSHCFLPLSPKFSEEIYLENEEGDIILLDFSGDKKCMMYGNVLD